MLLARRHAAPARRWLLRLRRGRRRRAARAAVRARAVRLVRLRRAARPRGQPRRVEQGLRLIAGVRSASPASTRASRPAITRHADCRRHRRSNRCAARPRRVRSRHGQGPRRGARRGREDPDARRGRLRRAPHDRARSDRDPRAGRGAAPARGRRPPPAVGASAAFRRRRSPARCRRSGAPTPTSRRTRPSCAAPRRSTSASAFGSTSSSSANPSPYFAVVSVGVNLGVLFQGTANKRAAAGRKQLVADRGAIRCVEGDRRSSSARRSRSRRSASRRPPRS